MITYIVRSKEPSLFAGNGETYGKFSMTSRPGIRQVANPAAADDGDEFRFCSTCAFSHACLSEGYDKSMLSELHVLVEHIGPFHMNEPIFREGDDFNAIAAVRAGTVKTFIHDINGNEHVLGFHLPGEVIGLNAIHTSRYPCNAVALDTVALCRFSFPKMALLATRLPGLQQQLFRLLSQDIGKNALLAGDFSADARIAAFLIELSRRYEARGFSPTRFNLVMTRADIAKYLRLAPETISRVFRRMRNGGIINVSQRAVVLLDMQKLNALAIGILRD